LNKEKETKLIESLIKDKEVAWIAKTIGRWDLLLGFYAKNIIEFAKVKDRILSKLSPHLEDYNLTFIEEAIILNRDYLLRDKRTNASEFLFTGKLKNEKIDNLDLSIIHELQNNSRKPILEIAHKLRLDARTIKNRIANLKHRQILQGQTIFLNLNKMNLQLHKLCITLQNYNLSNLQTMIDYCKYNPHIIHIIKSIGSWELELELEEENLEKVYHFIKLLKSEFSGIIKQVELVTIIEESKLEFFPERTKIDGAY
jgi:DNA-binding Lrp family transcriptional regulator